VVPGYRATILANEIQGRQSISCENSVTPAFIGGPSRGVGETAVNFKPAPPNGQKTFMHQIVPEGSFGTPDSSTVVLIDAIQRSKRFPLTAGRSRELHAVVWGFLLIRHWNLGAIGALNREKQSGCSP
jgi:hypothetical protein